MMRQRSTRNSSGHRQQPKNPRKRRGSLQGAFRRIFPSRRAAKKVTQQDDYSDGAAAKSKKTTRVAEYTESEDLHRDKENMSEIMTNVAVLIEPDNDDEVAVKKGIAPKLVSEDSIQVTSHNSLRAEEEIIDSTETQPNADSFVTNLPSRDKDDDVLREQTVVSSLGSPSATPSIKGPRPFRVSHISSPLVTISDISNRATNHCEMTVHHRHHLVVDLSMKSSVHVEKGLKIDGQTPSFVVVPTDDESICRQNTSKQNREGLQTTAQQLQKVPEHVWVSPSKNDSVALSVRGGKHKLCRSSTSAVSRESDKTSTSWTEMIDGEDDATPAPTEVYRPSVEETRSPSLTFKSPKPLFQSRDESDSFNINKNCDDDDDDDDRMWVSHLDLQSRSKIPLQGPYTSLSDVHAEVKEMQPPVAGCFASFIEDDDSQTFYSARPQSQSSTTGSTTSTTLAPNSLETSNDAASTFILEPKEAHSESFLSCLHTENSRNQSSIADSAKTNQQSKLKGDSELLLENSSGQTEPELAESSSSAPCTSPAPALNDNGTEARVHVSSFQPFDYRVGQKVQVKKGKHIEKVGTVIKITECKVRIQFNSSETAYINKTPEFISLLEQANESTGASIILNETSNPRGDSFSNTPQAIEAVPDEMTHIELGQRVRVKRGTYKDQVGTVIKITECKVRIEFGPSKKAYVNKTPAFISILQQVDAQNEQAAGVSDVTSPSPLLLPFTLTGKDSDEKISFKVGQRVKVRKGTYKDKVGTIIKITECKVRIQFSPSHKAYVNKTPGFICVLEEDSDVHRTTLSTGVTTRVESTPPVTQRNTTYAKRMFEVGDQVEVYKGAYEGKEGLVTGFTESGISVYINDEKPGIRCTCVRRVDHYAQVSSDLRVSGFDFGGLKFGDAFISSISTSSEETPTNTILWQVFGHRVLLVLHKVELGKQHTAPAKTRVFGDAVYQLVCTRDETQKQTGGRFQAPQKSQQARCYYVLESSPDVLTIDVEKELLRLANFAHLPSNKVAARMELLTTEAIRIAGRPAIFSRPRTTFKFLPNTDETEGCGFISEQLLLELCPEALEKQLAIQVRVLVPKLGLFKGMLIRKKFMEGKHDIELTSSMLKAGPSVTEDAAETGCIVIKNIFPSKIPGYIGRSLDPILKPPPEKSFKQGIKPLKDVEKDMILRLWQGLGVSKDDAKSYADRAKTPAGLKHAWLVGLADPTNHLPPGHIFIPGVTKDASFQQLEKIFITRSPCLEPRDGHTLPLIRTKPNHMSEEEWKWLISLPFGGVIFANPSPDMQSIPPAIADGDLDGDLYFTCWDATILRSVMTEPFVECPVPAAEKTGYASEGTHEWFSKAQEQMQLNTCEGGLISQLIAKLWGQCQKIANATSCADPDAIAFAQAFKKTLEYKKHRRPIVLPRHLIEQMPSKLREFLVEPSDGDSADQTPGVSS